MTSFDLHEQVERELSNHEIKADLWHKAMSQSGNDKEQARQLYKTYRLMQLQQERAQQMRGGDEYEVEAEEVPRSEADARPEVQPAQPQGYGQRPLVVQANNSLAVTALVLGVLSITCCGCLGGLPAIICGHIALARIQKGLAPPSGKWPAIIGLLLGWFSLALTIMVIFLGGLDR